MIDYVKFFLALLIVVLCLLLRKYLYDYEPNPPDDWQEN